MFNIKKEEPLIKKIIFEDGREVDTSDRILCVFFKDDDDLIFDFNPNKEKENLIFLSNVCCMGANVFKYMHANEITFNEAIKIYNKYIRKCKAKVKQENKEK